MTKNGYHHDDHGEDLLVSGVGRNVAEADGGEGGAGEVQGGHVGVTVLVENVFRNLIKFSWPRNWRWCRPGSGKQNIAVLQIGNPPQSSY